MTELNLLKWIDKNLGDTFDKAIADSKNKNPFYSRKLLVAMTNRETGFLINRYVATGAKNDIIWTLMKGDYGKRPLDTEKKYHGFGILQIDIYSFPDFVKSGDWKNPYKCAIKAIDVLAGKQRFLDNHKNLIQSDLFTRAIVSAYNCGEGNVVAALKKGENIDSRTHQKNYSAEVFRMMELLK